jgi:hypothetical protein
MATNDLKALFNHGQGFRAITSGQKHGAKSFEAHPQVALSLGIAIFISHKATADL